MELLSERELRDLTARYDQDHVWRWWPELNAAQRQQLLADLSSVDFDQVERLIRAFVESPPAKFGGELEPVEILSVPSSEQARRNEQEAREAGEERLRAGKVAAFVVAGGQGTRLGFDGPKGTFPITPIRAKSLFQLHAERILATSRRYGQRISWCIMTSEATDEPTREFFRRNGYFGLPPADVLVFEQSMMPSVDRNGKLLLAEKGRIAMNPNGHGGSIPAIYQAGALGNLEQRGIEIISYFQVDNVLVKPADPVFIGYHASRDAEMSSKVLRKRNWEEKLGIIGRLGGKHMVIEYMNMDDRTLKLTSPDGQLLYWAGSIAIHLLNVEFIKRLNESGTALPFHASEKKIPYVDADGSLVKPTQPNGIKFETFVFDAMPHARRTVAMEVARDEEFSPVKNSDDVGEDCPATARRDMQRLWTRWLIECGVAVPVGVHGAPTVPVEVSPLTALDAAELRDALPKGYRVDGMADL